MSTLAEKIKKSRGVEFKDFDLEAFSGWLEESFANRSRVVVGVEHDSSFKSGDIKRRTQVRQTESRWLAFADYYECGYWRTNCQIPRSLLGDVTSWLVGQGFKIEVMSLCGFQPAAIEITLD